MDLRLLPYPKGLVPLPEGWMPSRDVILRLPPSLARANLPNPFLGYLSGFLEEMSRRTEWRWCAEESESSVFSEGGGVWFTCVTDLKPEEFSLRIGPEGIRITAGEPLGFRNSLCCLRQIALQSHGTFPGLSIEDHPSLGIRGVLLDISRGRVPTYEALTVLARKLADHRVNHLQLYMERDYSVFSPPSSIDAENWITRSEITEFDAYCEGLGIDLVPSFSTISHLYDTFTSPAEEDLRELDPDPGRPFLWRDRMKKHTLNLASDRAAGFVRARLASVLPLFRSKRVNVNCDEPFDMGRGKGSELYDRLGGMEYARRMVRLATSEAERLGKEPMFYPDSFLETPDVLAEFRDGPRALCVTWDYQEDFGEEASRGLSNAGIPFLTQSGAQGWSRFVHDYRSAFRNTGSAARVALERGAGGTIVSEWGDFGHVNPIACAFPVLAYALAKAWDPRPDGTSGEERDAAEAVLESLCAIEHGDDGVSYARILADCSGTDRLYGWYHEVLRAESAWFGPEVRETVEERVRELTPMDLTAALERLDRGALCMKDLIGRACMESRIDMWEVLSAIEGQACMISLARARLAGVGADAGTDAASRIRAFLDGFPSTWLLRNRPSESWRVVSFLERTLKELQQEYLES
jgi:hypothetical protein